MAVGLICGENTGTLSYVLCIINIAAIAYLLWAKDPFRQLGKDDGEASE